MPLPDLPLPDLPPPAGLHPTADGLKSAIRKKTTDPYPHPNTMMAKQQFQQFSTQPKGAKPRVSKLSGKGKAFVDYKDTETLRRLISGNGKIQSRKRTGADAQEQRMLARAVKRARFMALVPYVATMS